MANLKVAGFCSDVTMDFKEQLRMIAESREKYISLEDIDGVPFTKMNIEDIKRETCPKLKRLGIEVASLVTTIGYHPIEDEEAYQIDLENLSVLIKVCDALKTKYINIYSPIISDGNYDEAYETVLNQMNGYMSILGKSNIILTVEHRAGTYCDSTERILKLVQDVNSSNLKIAFNPSSFVETKEVPMAAYRVLKSKVDFFYMHDVNSMNITVPIGMGCVKVYELLRMAMKENFSGFICLRSFMKEYLNRKSTFSKAFLIPGYILFSKNYRTFKHIDFVVRGDKKDVDAKYLFLLQMRLLRKCLTKIQLR